LVFALFASTCVGVHHQAIWITCGRAQSIDKTVSIFAELADLSHMSEAVGIHTVTGATLNNIGINTGLTTRRDVVETS